MGPRRLPWPLSARCAAAARGVRGLRDRGAGWAAPSPAGWPFGDGSSSSSSPSIDLRPLLRRSCRRSSNWMRWSRCASCSISPSSPERICVWQRLLFVVVQVVLVGLVVMMMTGASYFLSFDYLFFNQAAAGAKAETEAADAALGAGAASWVCSSVFFFLPPSPNRRKPVGGTGSI